MKYKLRQNYTTDPNHALEEILRSRGVKDIPNFINPSKKCELDPYKLENIEEAAECLINHIQQNSRILIVIDADADGFTSSSILWLYIKRINPNANLEFTIHTHKQHGLDDKIDWIVDEDRWDLIVVPDAGSYDVEEHRRIDELGTDCIVLDHHSQEYDTSGNPITSETAIVVNNQLSPDYSNKSLCGAGVVYKFCEVMDKILGVNYSQDYIDLAALGEIADVMDRTDAETNYIMLEGLKNIKNEGFKTLLQSQTFTLKDKSIPPYQGLTPIDVAFYIAPLINAITRVGTMSEKEAMFYCFIDPYRQLQSTKRGAKKGDIELAAEQTARVGKNAKARQDKLKNQAIELVDFKIQKDGLYDNNIIMVEIDDNDNIPPELTGLVATNIVNKYHKPTMIGRRNDRNELQGSIRSDNNFAGLPSFKKFLEDSKLMLYTAGHDNACGWGLDGAKQDALIEYGNTHLHAEDFENCYIVDYILDGKNDNTELMYALAAHPEYFGNQIEEIKIIVKNISLSNMMLMGANKDSTKVSYNKVDYVRFKDEEFVQDIMANKTKTLTVYGRININEFMGKTSIQLFIDDYDLEYDSHKYDF